MMDFIVSLFAFIVAIGVIVSFHEFGHLWVARKLGVKILRYSIGFGKPLWKKRGGADNTEYVIAVIPLGGYVKMLDEGEGDVDPAERHRAFNRQSLKTRVAIVAAGPLANFLLAFVLYFFVYLFGTPALRPVIGEVMPDSAAAAAGLERGDLLLAVNGKEVKSWQDAVLALLSYESRPDAENLRVSINRPDNAEKVVALAVGDLNFFDNPNAMSELGIVPWRPRIEAIMGRIISGGAAERAGLGPGDRVLSFQGVEVKDWNHLVELIMAAPEEEITMLVKRGEITKSFTFLLGSKLVDGRRVGSLGVGVQLPSQAEANPHSFIHRYGAVESLHKAGDKVWELTALTMRVLGALVIGQASFSNLSGPIAIADYAGKTMMFGVSAFLSFLAILSISVGIINLLPIPVLDGGRLLFFFIEWVKGSPLSDKSQAFSQSIGAALLMGLMIAVIYNDLIRLAAG